MKKSHAMGRGLLLAALAAGSLGLVGCGGGGGASENVFNFYENSHLKGLDPLSASTTYSHRAVSNLYEGLLQYNYLKRPYQVEPQLAVAMPTISEDELTYTFQIKKGVLFHDDACFPGGKGREVTAEDFVYSWKRIADFKNVSEGWWIFDGKIAGLNEFREYTKTVKGDAKVDYSKPVPGLTTPDKYTLRVQLTKPYPQLLYILTMGYTKVVPREAVEKYGKEFLNHPVGTGPFRLKKWIKGSKFVYLRNPTWRGETYPSEGEATDQKAGLLDDAGKKLPFVDKVVVNIMVESQPRWLQFMRGDLDLIKPPKDNYDDAMPSGKLSADMLQKGIHNIRRPSLDIVYTAFNWEDPVLGDLDPEDPGDAEALKIRKERFPHLDNDKARAIRRALSMAYNRDKLIELFYNGQALKAKGPLPPGLEGYDAEAENKWTEYDPEGAKKVLQEAGLNPGDVPPLQYQTSSSSTSMQMAQFRKSLYKKIGIDMEINTNTWPELNKKVKSKRAQIFGMAWLGDYPDAQNFLQLFYSPNESPGTNGANYTNKEFDELYRQVETMRPSSERTEIYKKMAKMVRDDVPWSFDSHRVIDTLLHGWLKNYKPHDAGHGFWKYYRIDTQKRAEVKPKL